MDLEKRLMTPGPTPLPPQVIEALGKQVLHHRTDEYADVLARLNDGLKYVFATQYPVVTLTASGTGGMEAAVVFFNRGTGTVCIRRCIREQVL